MHRFIRVLIVAAALTATGCSTQPTMARNGYGGDCAGENEGARSVQLDLIRQLVSQGQYYSALAHLEEQQLASPSARFLQAESLRKTGRLDEAYRAYDSLTRTCISAAGHLGKGKILAVRNELDGARRELLKAREQAPTDANIRNDYGFLLMVAGDYQAAEQEFMTAIQLNNEHPVAARNLIVSLILNGKRDMAWRLAQYNRIDVDGFRDLLNRSINFKRQKVAKNIADPDSGLDRPILERTGAPL